VETIFEGGENHERKKGRKNRRRKKHTVIAKEKNNMNAPVFSKLSKPV
jgi:hypothetical protein